MEQPKLQDYVITPKEYDQHLKYGLASPPDFFCTYIASPLSAIALLGFAAYLTTEIEAGEDWFLVGFMCLFGAVPGGAFIAYIFVAFKKQRYLRSDIPSKMSKYREGLRNYETIKEERQSVERARRRKALSFWRTLKDIYLEREVANLFRQMGYEVQTTPTSGDQGVDLFLRADGQTIVVQCKGLKSKASPTVVRDLYGAMLHFRADRAVLVCPTGFHRGVWEFVKDKPVTLVGAEALSIMAEGKDIGRDITKVGLQNRLW